MPQIVDLTYHFSGICNADDIDLCSCRSSGTDGNISDSNNSLPYTLHKIHSTHIFDPNFILHF